MGGYRACPLIPKLEGGEVMSIYEALTLMIAFAVLVIHIINIKKQPAPTQLGKRVTFYPQALAAFKAVYAGRIMLAHDLSSFIIFTL